MADRAVFLDRDGTIIEDPGFVTRPEQVCLVPGSADAIRRLRAAGYRVVVVTNQSGVARGLLDEQQLAAIHERMQAELARRGTQLDAIYYCPYLPGPEAVVEQYRRDSDLRKPKPGMLLRAARELGLDLAACWMIGDSSQDVEAGRAAACRTILIGQSGCEGSDSADFVVPDLVAAAEIIERDGRSKAPAASGQPSLRTESLLEQMLEELRELRRGRMYEEFSLAKLAAAVLQVVALGLFVWA
ncbi:MAG: D-glycero-alpha-D-manno-heptose-1,7-bisphosphate 7-phosphatase, partial [Phycisphaerae bacterium]